MYLKLASVAWLHNIYIVGLEIELSVRFSFNLHTYRWGVRLFNEKKIKQMHGALTMYCINRKGPFLVFGSNFIHSVRII